MLDGTIGAEQSTNYIHFPLAVSSTQFLVGFRTAAVGLTGYKLFLVTEIGSKRFNTMEVTNDYLMLRAPTFANDYWYFGCAKSTAIRGLCRAKAAQPRNFFSFFYYWNIFLYSILFFIDDTEFVVATGDFYSDLWFFENRLFFNLWQSMMSIDISSNNNPIAKRFCDTCNSKTSIVGLIDTGTVFASSLTVTIVSSSRLFRIDCCWF
jgi:hypothetical protein